jgi:hypothetical protein
LISPETLVELSKVSVDFSERNASVAKTRNFELLFVCKTFELVQQLFILILNLGVMKKNLKFRFFLKIPKIFTIKKSRRTKVLRYYKTQISEERIFSFLRNPFLNSFFDFSFRTFLMKTSLVKQMCPLKFYFACLISHKLTFKT